MRKELQQHFRNEEKPEGRWKLITDQAVKKQVWNHAWIWYWYLLNFKWYALEDPLWCNPLSYRALLKKANTLRKKSCFSIVTLGLTWMSVKGWTTCWRAPSVSIQKQVTTKSNEVWSRSDSEYSTQLILTVTSVLLIPPRTHFCSHRH